MPTLESYPIYYETKGPEAPKGTIVFAHGAGGNAAIWFNQVAHFATDYQVITFDHRSFGRTPTPQTPIVVSDFRDDLLALLDEHNVSQAHLVGQSMGGFTVLRTALDAPDRVASLTLSATSGGIYNPEPTEAVRNLTSSGDRNTEGVKATMSAATHKKPEMIALRSDQQFQYGIRVVKSQPIIGTQWGDTVV